jgi:hypothetical protein
VDRALAGQARSADVQLEGGDFAVIAEAHRLEARRKDAASSHNFTSRAVLTEHLLTLLA